MELYPNADRRPHPYQLMQADFLAYFLPFPALLSREKVVLGGYISDIFIRFSSRVGQVVGQKASGRILGVFLREDFGIKRRLDLVVKIWDGVNKDRQPGTQPVLFAKRTGVEFEDQFGFTPLPYFPLDEAETI